MSSLHLVMSKGYRVNCMSATNSVILPKSTDAVLADVCISQQCVVDSVCYTTHLPSGEDSMLYAQDQHLSCIATELCFVYMLRYRLHAFCA